MLSHLKKFWIFQSVISIAIANWYIDWSVYFFLRDSKLASWRKVKMADGDVLNIIGGYWGYFEFVFFVLYICDSGENYFFGNYIKYRSAGSKKNYFCCHFFAAFLITSHILIKQRQYSVLLRHFSCVKNPEWWFMKNK